VQPTDRHQPALVRHQYFESNALVCPYPAKFDLSLIEKLHQRRTRDIRHVRRFLRGELGVYRD
jgi:hypothetical protein